MSTQQSTIEAFDKPTAKRRTCPLCGKEGIIDSQLPNHIASDDCTSDLKG